MRIVFSPLARGDLQDIWRHIAADDPAAADRQFLALFDAAMSLRDFPDRGKGRPDLGQGIRMLVVARYLIFYRRAAERVEIVRILHGRMDIDPSDLF